MKLVHDSQATATANLILRDGPGTTYKRIITIMKHSIVRVTADPTGAWVKIEMDGWVTPDDAKYAYSDDHLKSSVKAARTSTVWERKTFSGWVSARFLQVIDGPQ
jgi:uncharacterized protein YraI